MNLIWKSIWVVSLVALHLIDVAAGGRALGKKINRFHSFEIAQSKKTRYKLWGSLKNSEELLNSKKLRETLRKVNFIHLKLLKVRRQDTNMLLKHLSVFVILNISTHSFGAPINPLYNINAIIDLENVSNPNSHPWIVNVIRRNGELYG